MTTQTEQRLSAALHALTDDQPFVPDVSLAERRGRHLRRRTRLARGAGGLAVTVVAAGFAVSTLTPASPEAPPAATAASERPLARLADTVLASQQTVTGDATLVLEHQVDQYGAVFDRAGVFADDGAYYFGRSEAEVTAAVAAGTVTADGVFARAVAAAVAAADGDDLPGARKLMAEAPLEPGTTPAVTPRAEVVDNWLWGNSVDALTAAGGRPDVRAGVLRILDSVPTVRVTRTTTDGTPTLTLVSAAFPVTYDDEQNGEGRYEETLVIDAESGVPLAFAGGLKGAEPGLRTTYQVSRTTIASLAGSAGP